MELFEVLSPKDVIVYTSESILSFWKPGTKTVEVFRFFDDEGWQNITTLELCFDIFDDAEYAVNEFLLEKRLKIKLG